MPYIGKSPSQAVRNRYYFTVASGATSVSGSDDNSNTLIFADGLYVDVYLNGVLLVADTDYVTSTANTIGSLSAMSANDIVEVIVYDVFSVFSGNVNSNFSVGGTLNVASGAVFNEDSADVDFRVESNGNANMLFVDGGNNQIGIGTATNIANAVLRVEGIAKFGRSNAAPNTGAINQFIEATTSSYNTSFENLASNPAAHYLIQFLFRNSAPNNTTAKFLQCRDSGGAKVDINSNGNITNTNNSYGAISDEKLKEQIVDSSSQWDDIKAIRVRKFKFKTDVATGDSNEHWRLGVVAQEVEASGMTGLIISETDVDISDEGIISDAGTETKTVKYSVLYMKAVKALQEAMTRIETLETKVKTLEDA